MSEENIWQALADTNKKIEGLKGFHVPVILQTIDNYEKAGADDLFIQQEKARLQKVYQQIEVLEQKAERLISRLNGSPGNR